MPDPVSTSDPREWTIKWASAANVSKSYGQPEWRIALVKGPDQPLNSEVRVAALDAVPAPDREKVAEALWRSAGFGTFPGEEVFAEQPEWVKALYEGQADAAIAAGAGTGLDEVDRILHLSAPSDEVWTTIIYPAREAIAAMRGGTDG